MRTLVYLHVFFLFYAFCLVSGKVVSEETILLEFKSSVSDPSGILSSWSSDTPDHCSWFGVTCDSESRVSELKIIGDACDGGNSESNFYFIGSRRNCSISSGKLVGKLLPLIGKLDQLRVLSLPFNEFSGEIPIEIWGLENLEVLDLEGNLLTGKLADQFDGLRKLRVFNLGFNRICGRIPFSLSKCERLHVLNLAGNKVNGRIPRFLSGFVQLRELYLSFNQLTGNVIGQFGNNCAILESLDLSGNFLIGGIPSSLGKCLRLKRFLSSSNKLDGVIPFELGQLRNLEVLDLSSNSFSGEIPQNLVKLRNLSVVLLNNNKLSGKIPSAFSDMTSLTTFNVKCNYLTDPLLMKNDLINHGIRFRRMLSVSVSNPTPDVGNEDLQNYSAPSEGSARSRKTGLTAIAIASVVCASAIFSVLLALVAFFFYTRRWSQNSRVQVAESREITLFNDIGVPLTYEKIIEGTGCFHACNCIGNGGFGATYKAEINARTLVAVKKLSVGRMQGVKHFHAEIKALETVKHPNLVTLIGYHASETEMFLIYNYFPGGNLENFIHKRPEASNWKIVHKIALHIAKGLAYLHEQCRVLHRDVKPSNILLDNDFNAYLSDFGLARLLGTSETHATTGVEGTFGYVAPEYALTCRVSEKSDVYSYGVVLLELISDKRALDPSFSSHANGFNIVSWADLLLRHGKGKEVFRTRLWESGPQNKMVEALHLAVRCTTESFTNRPTMKQVAWRMSQLGTPPS